MTGFLNLNDRVEVELTSYGYKVLDEYYEELGIHQLEYRRYPNELGFIEMQLWELMRIFGHKLHNGAKIPFKNNRVIVKEQVSG